MTAEPLTHTILKVYLSALGASNKTLKSRGKIEPLNLEIFHSAGYNNQKELSGKNYCGINMDLQDNAFNAGRMRHQPQLKLWRYAGLMLTYRCTAACRFCYYYCSPQAGGLMTADTAIAAWQGLIRIAGKDARVHITGGEPFLCFDRLAEICRLACRLGLTPIDSIETNGFCSGSDKELSEKLQFLNDCGLERLKISWDPFHEEYIDIEQVKRTVFIARRILGPQRVLVRWEKYLSAPSGIRQQSQAQRQAVLQRALADDVCRFTGRAAEALAHLAPQQPLTQFSDKNCRNALLSAKGVHIDPDGNVFVGQCSGMILGNVGRTPLDVIWKNWQPDRGDFWGVLYDKGPFGFLEKAQKQGFHPRSQYASKCHLCTDIRRFFFDNQFFSTIIGPSDCYGR
ncbi:MAG: hypothetical protein KBI46_00885 [Phycisphaerae bacterium]|nr:hypothetical protein [Phycisphaerae bacterium]